MAADVVDGVAGLVHLVLVARHAADSQQQQQRAGVVLQLLTDAVRPLRLHVRQVDYRSAQHRQNNAVTDRRLRPRCCRLGSYFKRPESGPVRPSACNWYYCAQFIAKPKAACALRFSWAATSSNLGL